MLRSRAHSTDAPLRQAGARGLAVEEPGRRDDGHREGDDRQQLAHCGHGEHLHASRGQQRGRGARGGSMQSNGFSFIVVQGQAFGREHFPAER